MSNRLNQDREKRLQPKRIQHAINELGKMGFEIIAIGNTSIEFFYKGNSIKYFPYSGWHTGKSIEDGRGWNHLKKQLICQ